MHNTSSLDLIDLLNAAPFQADGWLSALSDLARTTGSLGAQLIGFSEKSEPFFNCVAHPEPQGVEDFVRAGGGLASVNPRLHAGLAVPLLETLTDEAILSRAERSRHQFYNDILPLSRTAHFCGTTLIRDTDTMVGLALLRSSTEGEIAEDQHQLFKALAPHVRTAFRTQMLLKEHGTALLAGSLGALNLAVFICDGTGKVEAMTPMADNLVSEDGPLQLQGGVLSARQGSSQVKLSTHIQAVASGGGVAGASNNESLIFRNHDGLPLVLDVVRVPALECQLNFQPRALVLVRHHKSDPLLTSRLLMAAWRLTAAEAAVAMLLAEGVSTEAIAARREVSTGTVRMQLKSLYAKVGVHSQAELLARLRVLL